MVKSKLTDFIQSKKYYLTSVNQLIYIPSYQHN